MHKIEIQYEDLFTGKTETEVMYFHLNEFELAEMAMEYENPEDGGIEVFMTRAAENDDKKMIFSVLKSLFVRAYGRRINSDGRDRFVKKPEWVLELLPSPEFGAFYMKLSSDTTFAQNFWNGLVSKELLEKAKKVRENGEIVAPKDGEKKFRELTLEEQVAELQAKIAAKKPANE